MQLLCFRFSFDGVFCLQRHLRGVAHVFSAQSNRMDKHCHFRCLSLIFDVDVKLRSPGIAHSALGESGETLRLFLLLSKSAKCQFQC